jgi:tRNA(Ser,Leu) C12 N-acetylase TAN1
VLATSFEGVREVLVRELRPLARVRRGGYRNVVVAEVDDPEAFLDRVADATAQSPALRAALAKLVPIASVVAFATPAEFVDVVERALEPFVERLAGKSFFVRVVRRGHRGAIDTPAVERELGGRLWRALEARGERPVVRFDDPDVAVVIETLGDQAGIALIGRELRERHPFVRVR